ERAKIYATVATIYAQSNIGLHPERVVKYAHLALQDERDPIQRATLHIYLGCAAEVDAVPLTFAEKRTQAARVYLQGYKELLALKWPAKPPDLPDPPPIFNVDGADPKEAEAARKASEAYLKARQEAEVIRVLLDQRRILIGQLAQLYQRPPAADAELR